MAASSALPAKSIKLAMKPDAKPGSDGKTHDALVPSAEITVKAGQTVRLTILNYDDMPHSFTSPGLARGAAIPPAFAADAGDRAGPEGDAGARPQQHTHRTFEQCWRLPPPLYEASVILSRHDPVLDPLLTI